jgi:PiT family inorganic phosphate transporter
VSFSHGSNDGQKGVGLVMIILIAIVPAKFALDLSRDPVTLKSEIEKLQYMFSQVNTGELTFEETKHYNEISAYADSINRQLTGVAFYSQASSYTFVSTRKNILILSKKSDLFFAQLIEQSVNSITPKWIKDYNKHMKEIKTFTEYSPWWVIFLISISLGLGTMIGWKRIVVTLGEKIGKSHLTYAQGAAANLIAASTISVSSLLGLPVSTTHILSSGIAGTMVSGNGMKNLQTKTLTAIGIAWLITIPVTMLFSGVLFLLFRILLT